MVSGDVPDHREEWTTTLALQDPFVRHARLKAQNGETCYQPTSQRLTTPHYYRIPNQTCRRRYHKAGRWIDSRENDGMQPTGSDVVKLLCQWIIPTALA